MDMSTICATIHSLISLKVIFLIISWCAIECCPSPQYVRKKAHLTRGAARQTCTAPQASSGSSSRCALRPVGLQVVLPAVCPLLVPMLCRKEAVGIMTLDTVLRRDAYTSSQQTMGSNRRPTGLAGSRYFPPWHGRWAERKQQSC